ncbi:MAG: DUF932 domain-containing protein [Lentisphaeria bacterium]|jgi:hypothetical protein|nr:DUF932 domain-containing protein [Lentisphaeria bacterium]
MLIIGTNENYVDRQQLAMVQTPEATSTWLPVPHMQLIESVEKNVYRHGWRIASEQFGLSRDGQRLFGVMAVANADNRQWTRTIGLRNSHDKSLCVGISAGVNVLVCSNLAFGGTEVLQRRHTSGIDVDLLVEDGMRSLADGFLNLELALKRLQNIWLSEDQARRLIVRIAEADAIPSCDILPVFREFQQPRHAEFENPSCWSLLNAITELSHKYAPARADKCHRRLTRLFGLDGEKPQLELSC